MSVNIKPIETVYKGVRFRSRLEARYAVGFDHARITWQYEPQGFSLDGVPYLPDFWFPQVEMFAEVKRGEFSQEEKTKCYKLAAGTGYPVLMLDGPPSDLNYWAFCPVKDFLDKEMESPLWPGCYLYDFVIFNEIDYHLRQSRFFFGGHCLPFEKDEPQKSISDAVQAALSARFEHGESRYR